MKTPTINQLVRLKVQRPAYYSGRNGLPIVLVPAGTVGVVRAVKCASVTREGVKFNCVDVKLLGNIWRVAVTNKEIEPAQEIKR